ncbi:MAG TPA: DedA family protein [Candidatus Limnocylindria bacterium]|nr:DedA family protein [Candidatus Limnocylindria bacterium]
MSHILSLITNFIIHIISSLGYSGVALLMAIESACIPLPSEIIAPFSGYLVFTGQFSLFWVAVAGGVGSMIGSWVTYEIGKHHGRPLVEKYGKWILISHEDLEITDRFFKRFGHFSTFIGRLLPVVRTFISLPAGVARVPKFMFLVYSFVGSFIWTYFLAYLGLKLGENWATLHERFHWFDNAIIFLILIVAALWVYRHLRRKTQLSKQM